MSAGEALVILGVDVSEIVRDPSEEDDKNPVLGTYNGHNICVSDDGDSFFIGILSRKKIYRVYKSTGVVEEVHIYVA